MRASEFITSIPSSTKVAWAGGLFEGEGCFSDKRLSLYMTDKDTVLRFATMFGLTAHGPYGPYGARRLPTWRISVRDFESRQAFIAAIWPWLGARRQQQAKDSLRPGVRRASGRARSIFP